MSDEVLASPGVRRWRAPGFMLAVPAWAWFVMFFVLPVGFVILLSFGAKPDIFRPYSLEVLSFDQYAKALDPAYGPTLKNTLRVGITGTIACLVIALPFAYWLAVRVPPRWRGLLLGLVLVPFWTNFLVRTIGWQLIISPDGIASSALQQLGVISQPLNFLYSRSAVLLGVVYNYLPLMILPLFVAFDRLDPTLREASKDLGASRYRTFTQVTLPLAMPGVVAGLALVFIPLMGDYITAEVLGGAKGNMLGQLIASQFLSAQNWPLGAAMAVLLMLSITVTGLIFALVGVTVRGVLRRRRRIVIDVLEVAA
ncbi:MAG: ABC transporter permease [Actinomycetota bacterium]|nr:ABC transporter permease [Actinomycetota bacterium]MDH4352934.1 ABC transporter permease [Actinomycetota bacterium]MDH5278003.1 ABC transporter permease [Actinomycetota bacterium]